MEIQEPLTPPRIVSFDSDEACSLPAPVDRTVSRTLTYLMIVHMEEVLDRGSLLTDHLPLSRLNKKRETTCKHRFVDDAREGGGQPSKSSGIDAIHRGLEDNDTV